MTKNTHSVLERLDRSHSAHMRNSVLNKLKPGPFWLMSKWWQAENVVKPHKHTGTTLPEWANQLLEIRNYSLSTFYSDSIRNYGFMEWNNCPCSTRTHCIMVRNSNYDISAYTFQSMPLLQTFDKANARTIKFNLNKKKIMSSHTLTFTEYR